MNVSIFGNGNMGKALGDIFSGSGNVVEHIGHELDAELGELVILAVPYNAIEQIVEAYSKKLAGKIIVDITNPVNFATFDELVVPADQSVASKIQAALPNSQVVKGFNTNFAAHLSTHKVADQLPVTVLLASDSDDAKEKITSALSSSPLNIIDAGSLKRARELEATGFLQMTLAARELISWSGGFGLLA